MRVQSVKSIPLTPGCKEKPRRLLPKLNPRDWFFFHHVYLEKCTGHEKYSIVNYLATHYWRGDWQLISSPFYYPVIAFRFVDLKICFTRAEDAVKFKMIADTFKGEHRGNGRLPDQ